MKKILLIITFIVGGIGFAEAQQQNDCAGQSHTCSDGSQGICTRMRGTAPYEGEPPASYRLLCFVDGESHPPSFNNGNKKNTKEKDVYIPKKCPTGQTLLSDGKTCSDCGGTLAPTITPTQEPQRAVAGSTWLNMLYRSGLPQPTTQPEQARPAAAGPSIGGFAGILPGLQCIFKYADPIVDEYMRCMNDSSIPPNIREKECLTRLTLKNLILPDLGVTYNLRGKFDCGKASVFDALWGFLTHRKPY